MFPARAGMNLVLSILSSRFTSGREWIETFYFSFVSRFPLDRLYGRGGVRNELKVLEPLTTKNCV